MYCKLSLDNDAGYIYVIQCKNNIIYVGFTSDIYKRLAQHFGDRATNHQAPSIFKENKPLNIMAVYRGAYSDENKLTYYYMNKYGIDKVYGGDLAGSNRHIFLDEAQVKNITLITEQSTSIPNTCLEIYGNHFDLWLNLMAENTRGGTCKLTVKKLLDKFFSEAILR